jgi:diacylglycerol O-acyltransferase
MSTNRLSPLDASFLHIEDGSSHMHVAAALLFTGDPPDYERLLGHIESRLGLVPRYRQRLAEVPLAQARPRWVDDERFDLRYHVRHTALPAPGSEYELQVLAGRVFSQQLRRDRPLWELWLVSGLEGGRFAILSKTHHALVDGVSGLDILSVLFAPDSVAPAEPWSAQPSPSTAGLVAEALMERATSAGELVRPLRAAVRGPRQALGRMAETAVAAGSRGPALRSAKSRRSRTPSAGPSTTSC